MPPSCSPSSAVAPVRYYPPCPPPSSFPFAVELVWLIIFTYAVYIFVGCIIPHGHWTNIMIGSIIAFIGAIYVALEFVPSIEPPQNMREADGGWGAEQV